MTDPKQVKLIPFQNLILAGRTPEENYAFWLRKWAKGEGAISPVNGPTYAWDEVERIQQEMIDSGEWKP
jgi:hypothetical protein